MFSERFTMSTGWLIAFTVIYFASGIIMCPVSKAVADDKGYNGILFAVATVFFSGIGLLCACALPDKKGHNYSEVIRALTEKVAELTEAVKTLSEVKKTAENPVRGDVQPPRREEAEGEYRRRDPREELYSRPAFSAKKRQTTANLVFKDGKLICSACGERISFNDKTCPHCGADIVPAKDSEGGFFKKK